MEADLITFVNDLNLFPVEDNPESESVEPVGFIVNRFYDDLKTIFYAIRGSNHTIASSRNGVESLSIEIEFDNEASCKNAMLLLEENSIETEVLYERKIIITLN